MDRLVPNALNITVVAGRVGNGDVQGVRYQPVHDQYSARPVARHDHLHGLQQDLQVEPGRTLVDVFEIERHAFVVARVAAPADLPQTGHAGQHAQIVPAHAAVAGQFGH